MNNRDLFFIKYTEPDFDVFFKLVSSDSVMKYITGKALTAPEARTKFESIIAINAHEVQLGYFKVLNADNEFIGDCKLERYNSNTSKLEIGYILKPEYWGLGYGTAICKKLIAIANLHFPKQDIIGIIDPDNLASKRLLEKQGFKSFFIGIEDNLPTEKLILKHHTNNSKL